MAKYSGEFKLMVVKEYLDGSLGLRLLVSKHNIKSHSQLRNWVKVYKEYGAIELSRKKIQETYSVQFKLDVLNFMKRTGASLTETALHFGLTNPPMITSWKKKFLEGGTEALDKPRGQPAMPGKSKNTKKSKQPAVQNEMTREQKLEQENDGNYGYL